jgi:TonB family protein
VARVTAAFAALADPDARAPRTRALAYLAWAALLSIALHAAVLTWLDTLPFRFGGPLRLALSARLLPVPEEAAPGASSAAPRVASPEPAEPKTARPAPAGAQATLPHLYFSASDVDVPAKVLEIPPLIYPENPYIWKLRGTVRVRVFIGEDGHVDTVELVSAEPPGHFEEAALIAARQLRYRPAEIRGLPVRSRRLIEILFDPHEHLHPAGAPPAGSR